MALTPAARVGVLLGAGLFFAASGLISFLVFPKILKWQVELKFVLSPEAEPYQYWKDVPVPIYVSFYFFNVTNPHEIVESEAKPILEEMGPYIYRETREKINITWNDNGTVSYKQIRKWFFQPHLTPGHLDDVITTLNVAMVSSANRVKHEEEFFKYAVTAFIEETNSTMFVRRSIRELLFDGYYDALLAVGKEMKEFNVQYDKFGWFYMKNDTDDNEYTIFTGENGMENYGNIDRWNGSQNIHDSWSPPCNQIAGTAGDMWPPYTNNDRENLTIFVSDICRSLYLKYNENIEFKGIKARRYKADHTLFDNGRYSPSNKCFCSKDFCLPPGVLNISACTQGSPALVSYPHFLYADSEYLNGVIGLKPNVALHSFFMDLEPDLGIPINVAARTQVNILVEPIEGVEPFSSLTKKTVFPIFWSSQTAEVDEEMAKKLIMVTEEVPHYVTIGSFFLVAIGGFIIILTLVYTVRISRARTKMQTYKAVLNAEKQMELL